MDFKLVEIGGRSITLATVVAVLCVLLATLLLARGVRAGFARVLKRRGVEGSGSMLLIGRLISYALTLIGIAVALQTAGIDLGAIFAASAVFAVGLGVALQGIAQNFVAGMILVVEKAVKLGDVLELDGEIVRVTDIGIRATLVRTLDEEDIIVPNSMLVQEKLKNYTLRDALYRVRVAVGVSYGSDLALVRRTLESVAASVPWRKVEHEPVVILDDFGASSIDYEVSVWTESPWTNRRSRSDLRERIWTAFREAGIVISFPQLDVHLDPPVTESLRSMGRAA